jgi:hypothetical protein
MELIKSYIKTLIYNILRLYSYTSMMVTEVLPLLLIFCTARWLMPLDVPQPVRLIVLTLL